jgi:hypothetical protein
VLKEFLNGQIRYLTAFLNSKIGPTDDQIGEVLRWHLEPIKLLLNAGYRHIRLQDEGAKFTSIIVKSDFDHVFVKESLLTSVDASVSVIMINDLNLSTRNAIKLSLSERRGPLPQPIMNVADIDNLIVELKQTTYI